MLKFQSNFKDTKNSHAIRTSYILNLIRNRKYYEKKNIEWIINAMISIFLISMIIFFNKYIIMNLKNVSAFFFK